MIRRSWQDPSLDYSGDIDEMALGRDRLLMEAQVKDGLEAQQRADNIDRGVKRPQWEIK